MAATAGPVAVGQIGAGAGATVAKWQGPDAVLPGGIGSALERAGSLVVAALVAANAVGSLRGEDRLHWPEGLSQTFGHTTIGVVATNAKLDKVGCLLTAQSAHDGVARALEPAHATVDGDAVVAAAVGDVIAPVDQVRLLAARAVEDAIRAAVGQ
jgi:L-aminopeptidase/D-esterase-like protein